ncbi:MAG: winged helix-turn-helix transcriptional regulator [Zestosphaera sp.]
MRTSLLNILTKIEGEVRCDELSELVGLSRSTTRRYMRELLDEGYVIERSRNVFILTDKGRAVRESLQRVLKNADDERAYVVTDPSTGTPLNLKIKSLRQLYVVIKYGLVPEDVIREHLRRGYISGWVRDVLEDEELARKLSVSDLDEVIRILRELTSLTEQALK